nr:13202_t:CDS:2 [Entrophospora candida]
MSQQNSQITKTKLGMITIKEYKKENYVLQRLGETSQQNIAQQEKFYPEEINQQNRLYPENKIYEKEWRDFKERNP